MEEKAAKMLEVLLKPTSLRIADDEDLGIERLFLNNDAYMQGLTFS